MLKLGKPLSNPARYSWGVTPEEVNAEVGARTVRKYRNFVKPLLPDHPADKDRKFVRVFWNPRTRYVGSDGKGSGVRRMIKADASCLSFAELLEAIYVASVEVKGRKEFVERRTLRLGRRPFREHQAPFSVLDGINSLTECINNAVDYASDALMLYLAWQGQRHSEAPEEFDDTFQSEHFVRDLFLLGGGVQPLIMVLNPCKALHSLITALFTN